MVWMTSPALEQPKTESFWLRKAKLDLLRRDPVDAVNDAEALARFTQGRLDQLLTTTED